LVSLSKVPSWLWVSRSFQALDGLTNGFPVGQHAAQPAVVNIELSQRSAASFTASDAARLVPTNSTFALLAGYMELDEVHGIVKHRNGFFQVDDVNLAGHRKM
jgi:hypothetical protein